MDKNFPFTYLGYPIYYGRRTKSFLTGCWSILWRSWMVGKVICSLMVGNLFLLNMSRNLFRFTSCQLWDLLRVFWTLWKSIFQTLSGSSGCKNKYHWASWQKLCLRKDEGGVDIRKMEEISVSHIVKGWWRLRTHPSL